MEEASDPFVHMIAGSFAGIAEHFSIFPIDTVKTHVQTMRLASASGTGATADISAFAVARNLLETRGFGSLWRGVSMQVGFCGPAHALMFASYEKILQMGGCGSTGSTRTRGSSDGGDGDGGASGTVQSPERVAAVGFLAGAVSTVLHDTVMVPAETVKQRLQLGYYRGPLHCLSRMIANGGGSLYRSFGTTLATNIPYGAVMMATNESIKKAINPEGDFSLATYLFAGGVSGSLAGLVTTPADVVKTRLQTQSLGAAVAAKAAGTGAAGAGPAAGMAAAEGEAPQAFAVLYQGFGDASRAIWREEGWLGFTRGAGPRMLMYGPSCAISWGAYETAKHMLFETRTNAY